MGVILFPKFGYTVLISTVLYPAWTGEWQDHSAGNGQSASTPRLQAHVTVFVWGMLDWDFVGLTAARFAQRFAQRQDLKRSFPHVGHLPLKCNVCDVQVHDDESGRKVVTGQGRVDEFHRQVHCRRQIASAAPRPPTTGILSYRGFVRRSWVTRWRFATILR